MCVLETTLNAETAAEVETGGSYCSVQEVTPRVKCLLLLARGPAARQLQPGLPQPLFSGMTLLCLL